MGRWGAGQTRIKREVDKFFKSLTWEQIIDRLEGRTPIIFILTKNTGKIHNVIVKDGGAPLKLAAGDSYEFPILEHAAGVKAKK